MASLVAVFLVVVGGVWLHATGVARAGTDFADAGLVLNLSGASYLAAPDGSQPVKMAFGTGEVADVAYSRDGKRIAFSRRGDVYVVKADGSGLTRLTSGTTEDTQPVWSPDSNHIAFTRCVVADCEVWVMTSTGSNQRQITTVEGSGDLGTDPAWSPDGRLIAFRDIPRFTGCNLIWVVRPDGSHVRALTSCPERNWHDDFSPSWSPNGKRIAFTRDSAGSFGHERGRVMVMNRDGTHLRSISPRTMRMAGAPRWSPDGSMIAFTRLRPYSVDAMLMRSSGRDAVMLAAHANSGSWRPTACTIQGTSGRDRLSGTPGDDVICAGGNNDVIAGHGGTDIISGGAGSDTVTYGWASHGVDVRLAMHAYANGIEYLSGIENVSATRFADTIRGSDVASIILGLAGPDTIHGGRGADTIVGGPGIDRLFGGRGNDALNARDGRPGDLIDGGQGTDTCRSDPDDIIRSCES